MPKGDLPAHRWTLIGPPEVPYGRPLVADRPKILAGLVLAQRSTEPRYVVRGHDGLEWKLGVGGSSSWIDTDDRPLPRDFGWSRESQWRHDSSDLIGRTRLKWATGERNPYWWRKGRKAGLLGELFTLGREYAARRPFTILVPDETVGYRWCRSRTQTGRFARSRFILSEVFHSVFRLSIIVPFLVSSFVQSLVPSLVSSLVPLSFYVSFCVLFTNH